VFAVGLSPMIAYWAAGLIGECSGATQSAMPTNLITLLGTSKMK
jgi:hypothetical protein